MSCPICGASYGFHEDGIHTARPIIPPEKDRSHEALKESRCNCGALYTERGNDLCRNPNHGGR